MTNYKVIANLEQLQSIDIDYNITDKIGSEVAIYGNWVVINIDAMQYDIPRHLLEKI